MPYWPYLRYFSYSLYSVKKECERSLMVCCVSALWLADCYSPAPLYKAEPQHSAAEKGVIPSNPLTMKMQKLLVNVSLFFSEVAFIQIFGFLAHSMDGSLMFFFQCLRRATFLSWRGCYLHGKMLYVCSQSSSHRISQGSLTEKATCISLKYFSHVLAK